MRPVKLIMSAFGPYADTTEVDFDALGTAGVYLVCGDTGAGKTMIFDAICFALFGEASGDAKGGARSTSSLRSDYAERTTDTFVELVFEYRGERYRIRRNPEYLRAKARGEGETKRASGAEMELADGRVVSGVRKVNTQVEELLGIDSEQFKQIVMLAQGEFRKLLTADTETREVIFRKLFGTHVYEEVQERLAQECRALERENVKAKAQIAGFAGRARFPEGSSASEELEQKKATEGQLGGWLRDALCELLAVDEPEHARLDAEVEALRRKWSDANALLKQIEVRPALEQDARNHEAETSRLKEAAPALAAALEAARAHDDERSHAMERAARIEGTFPKYEELKETAEEQARMKAEDDEARRALEARTKETAETAALVKRLTDEVSRRDGADIRRVETSAKLDSAKTQVDAAARALDEAKALAEKRALLAANVQAAEPPYQKALEALARDEAAHDADLARLNDLQKRQRAGRAGLLAAELEEGAPCPVCGSVHHPAPAPCAPEGSAIPTDAELDAAAEAEARSKAASTADSITASQLKTVLDERRRQLGTFDEEHGGDADLEERIKLAQQALEATCALRDDAEAAYKQTAREADDLARYEAELDAARKRANQEGELLERAQTKARDTAEARRLVGERLSHLKSDLEFASLSDAQSEAARLRQKATSLKTARDTAETALRENAAALHTHEELLKAATKRLAEIPQADEETTKATMARYQQKAEQLKDEAARLKTRIDANRSCLDGLQDVLRHAGDIERRYGRVKLLADVATGNLVGRQKIRFEAYVQAIYFDKVIEAANVRLKMLTGGQFQLVRHSEGTGNAKAGLGLYVSDSFTGRARDASSLSGGESFQASLCLALGLSDIVQAHAGGVEFDTMFVDEGFGSLDQGALGNAISLLSDLSAGTKLVGIISHVEDLKANIPKKIVVTKTRTGSSVTLDL